MKILKVLALIVCGLLIIVIVVNIILFTSIRSKKLNIEKMEYKTDFDPIYRRFPLLENIEKCFWKADSIKSISFGPTSYWMKGFILLNQKESEKISNGYKWNSAKPEFPAGISPEITGFISFDWRHCDQFDLDIRGLSFVGKFYFDETNGILYFDLESN